MTSLLALQVQMAQVVTIFGVFVYAIWLILCGTEMVSLLQAPCLIVQSSPRGAAPQRSKQKQAACTAPLQSDPQVSSGQRICGRRVGGDGSSALNREYTGLDGDRHHFSEH